MRSAFISAVMLMSLAACGKADAPPADAPADTASGETPAADPAATPVVAANVGEMQFKKCVACHTIAKGGNNGVGPNLWGVVGRPVGAHAGFAFSPAMKAKGGAWDEAALDTYLTQPMKAVPGTKMSFAGIANAADRAALIAWMKTQAD